MRVFIFLLFFVCFAACGKNRKPEDMLPQQKMENVIWDMVMADEYFQNYILKDSVNRDVKAERFKLYEQVFKIHNITRDQFQRSYKYYASQPGESKVLFDSLSARANRRLEEVYRNPQ